MHACSCSGKTLKRCLVACYLCLIAVCYLHACVQAYRTLRTVWVVVSHPDNGKSKAARRFFVRSDIVRADEHPLGAAKFVLMAMHVTRCPRECI